MEGLKQDPVGRPGREAGPVSRRARSERSVEREQGEVYHPYFRRLPFLFRPELGGCARGRNRTPSAVVEADREPNSCC